MTPPDPPKKGTVPFSAYRPTPEFEELLLALCDDALNPEQARRLEEIVIADDGACWQYLRQVHLHGALHWNIGHAGAPPVPRSEEGGIASPAASLGTEVPGPSAGDEAPAVADLEPLISPIIIHDSSPAEPPRFSALLAPGGWAFSYAAATVITGVMLLVFWGWTVSHERELVQSPPVSEPPTVEREKPTESVGRITGTADCRLADPRDVLPTAVPLGGKYALASGLLEISYDTGAKVILQGPCRYEVDSARGGFLSLGKVTARVEKSEVRNQRSEARDPKSEISNPQSPIPNPLFVVRTPTAVVTDLGTEFGVEVDKSGATRSHVFRGKVEMRTFDGGGAVQVVSLQEKESAWADRGSDGAVTVTRPARSDSHWQEFVRHLPARQPIGLFNTGIGIAEGDPDPHWQLVARSDDPHFKPQAAVVSRLGEGAFGSWLANDPARSRWISIADGPPWVPNGVTYTFRTTFEVAGALPETFVLRGRFIGDNHVNAMRLNGKPVRVFEHGIDAFDRFTEFSIEKGFVEGTNVLEFDVRNGLDTDVHNADASNRAGPRDAGSSPMGLRVEWNWATPARQPGDDAERRGKEGAAMN